MKRTPLKRTGFKRKTYSETPQNPSRQEEPLGDDLVVVSYKKAPKTVKKAVKKKVPTKSALRKKLDALFSIYIRTKYADSNGFVTCYTCPKRAHYKEMQNGHFCPRQYLATRYDERNCRVQCYACNMLFNGQPSTFAMKLEAEQKGIVAELDKLRHVTTKDFPYLEMIEKYKNEI